MATGKPAARAIMVFVLDTSALTDPRLREVFRVQTLDEVVKHIVGLLREARTKLGIEFYTTPTMFSEMKRFLLSNGVQPETIEMLQAWMLVKAPDKLSVRIPAIVMAEYVEDMRRRLMKGLRVAEEAVWKAVREAEKARAVDEKRKQEEFIGPIIRNLREKYREATRRGIVDSLEDFDVVILALELKAVLVTNDEGIKRLAETLGVIVVDPLTFVRMLRSYLEVGVSGRTAS
ncbi:protein of unknown function UPF0278 [Pyrolobus fumarii 1A]|uniref:RNA-free ribonuclease P n=1 Tax=Pyrolobus fumarii (strain DSM 11204 / 1A) TaxID=694429 RepID=G0EDP6_PYRF1|nr:RNA ligase partner protein [Pyrolobus fumarii]AEM37883.1 protein of unknown function UPF0278 [Pyrolobus fumarii 1A]